MKTLFIFILYTFLFIYGCSSSNQHVRSEGEIFITNTYQHWFASAPGESEFTERGIDLRLKLYPENSISNPLHIIFNERKSFPVTVIYPKDSEEKLFIEGRILLESSLFNEHSDHVPVSDRLVFRDKDGSLHYEEINDWKRLPDRYE